MTWLAQEGGEGAADIDQQDRHEQLQAAVASLSKAAAPGSQIELFVPTMAQQGSTQDLDAEQQS